MEKAKYIVTVENKFCDNKYIRDRFREFRESIYSNPLLTVESSTSGSDTNTWKFTFSFEDEIGSHVTDFSTNGLMMRAVGWSYRVVVYTHSEAIIRRADAELPLLSMGLSMEAKEEIPDDDTRVGLVWRHGSLFRNGIFGVYNDKYPIFAVSRKTKDKPTKIITKIGGDLKVKSGLANTRVYGIFGVEHEKVPFIGEAYEFGGKRYTRTKIKDTNEYLNNMRLCMTQPEPQNPFKSREMPL